MAHKVLVNGTNYAVKGGRTLVGGTGYAVKGGKTLVGGTAYNISFVPPLAECTPAQIQEAAQSGQAPNYWSVGDKIGIYLSGTVGVLSLSDTYYAFIIGFNHNSSIEGGNSIHFQFGKTGGGTDIAFVDSNYLSSTYITGSFQMNESRTKKGGWSSSYMRNTICPAFLAAMPTAWQNVVTACTKYSDNTGDIPDIASYVTSTNDKIFLLAEWELFGKRKGANNAEGNYQQQYEYYKNGSYYDSKVKNKHNSTDSACNWWLRSVYTINGSDRFCMVLTTGSSSYASANYSYGLAPCFKVA